MITLQQACCKRTGCIHKPFHIAGPNTDLAGAFAAARRGSPTFTDRHASNLAVLQRFFAVDPNL